MDFRRVHIALLVLLGACLLVPTGLAQAQSVPAVDAKIEIVWPHDQRGDATPIGSAPLVNIEVYLGADFPASDPPDRRGRPRAEPPRPRPDAGHRRQLLDLPGLRSVPGRSGAARVRPDVRHGRRPFRPGARAGHLERPAGALLPDLHRHGEPADRLRERGRQPVPVAVAEPGDPGAADEPAGLRPEQPRLRLPAFSARHHALRRRLRLHPGQPDGRLPQGDHDRPGSAGRLDQEAAKSSFFLLYDPNRPRWVRNPNALPYTDLTNAFVRQ